MPQLTLAGCYGPKPPALNTLLRTLSGMARDTLLKDHFAPYPIEQVHGTLVGLEKIPGVGECYNLNHWKTTGEKRLMALSCLLDTLAGSLPMQICIGGFPENYDGFRSLGDTPYRRSFGIDWASGRVVLIGWPCNGSMQSFDFTSRRPLWRLRKRLANRCFIRHKYHEQEDNDFYMVLGTLHFPEGRKVQCPEVLKKASREIETRARVFLHHNPISFALDPDTVSVVRYERESLELSSSRAWNIRELPTGDPDFHQLYL